MDQKQVMKIQLFILPLFVAFLTTILFVWSNRQGKEQLIQFSLAEEAMLMGMLFLGFYIFILLFVTSVSTYALNKRRIWRRFIVLNGFGFVLILLVDGLMLDNIQLWSLYLIYPLFTSVFVLIQSVVVK